MKKLFVMSLLFGVVLIAPGVHGSQRVAMTVTPAVALEPAFLTVRTITEPSDENRMLRVTLDSGDYATSSDIPLEGRHSARLNVVELRDVPSGLYEVTAVLSGSNGQIATTGQLVKIQPAPGGGRRR